MNFLDNLKLLKHFENSSSKSFDNFGMRWGSI